MYAATAIAMVAVTSMVWAQPAQAAPAGLCTVQEWTTPALFADCAGRLGKQATDAVGCVGAPMPGSPTSGMPGMFSSRPESSLRSGVTGRYSMYGTGGYGLDTYDLGCMADIRHPGVTTWNTIASGEFWLASLIVSAANGLREWAYEPSLVWGWADGFVESATTAIFEYVFSVLGTISIIVVGLLLVVHSRHGQMSKALTSAGWALFIMVAITAIARYPVYATHAADSATTSGIDLIHSAADKAIGPGPQNGDDPECRVSADPAACIDHRTPAVRASDSATEAILYRSWLRAVLGSADGPTADKYGPALYDATTLTWDEQARADQSPQLRKNLLDQKAATFNAIAAQLSDEDPEAYEHLQGIHGWDRASAGLFAVLAALAFAAFDMTASLVVLFGFAVFRIAVVIAPLVGSYGVIQPASGGVRRITNTVVASAFNIVIFGGVGALYLAAFARISSSSMPPAAQLAITALLSVACLIVLRPIRHMTSTLTGRARSEDGLGQRLWNAGKEIATRRPAEPAAAASEAPTSAPPAPTRPEATPGPSRPEATPVPPRPEAPPSAPPRPEHEPVAAPAEGRRSTTAVLTEAVAPSASGFVKRLSRPEGGN